MNKFNIFILFFSLLLYFAISIPYYSGDVKNHLVWAQSIIDLGPMGFYDREFHDYAFPNYPPVAMWSFVLSLEFYRLSQNLIWFINLNVPVFPSMLVNFFEWENVEIAFLKLPAMLPVIAFPLVFGSLLKKFSVSKKIITSLLFLLNPAVIYLSAVWGQFDLLPVFLFLLAISLYYKERIYFSVIVAALALLTKQTVLLFWLVYIGIILQKYGVLKAVKAVLLTLVIFYLAYLPFHSFSLTWPFELYRLNFSMVAKETSVNTLNFWGFIFNFKSSSDSDLFFNLSYQSWGYILFGFFAFLLILNLFWNYLKIAYEKINIVLNGENQIQLNNEKLILFFLNLTFVYFFFLTRMHERYLAPAIVFSVLLLPFSKKYWLSYFFISVLYFINLYKGLLQPDIPFFNMVTSSVASLDFLTVGFFLVIFYNLFLAFYNFKKKK